jgi:hypothetical protein
MLSFGNPVSVFPDHALEPPHDVPVPSMKRAAEWAFYALGALALAYLALYAYAAFTGRSLEPGDPIHIFRKPDAPSYS